MRFDILGPLRMVDGPGEHPVTAGRDRIVLSMLLLHPGRVVAVDDLVDAVWEDAPPATARGQLQTCVSRLRRALPSATIVTDPAGYGIAVGADSLDATAFVQLTRQARAAARSAPDDARRLFRQGLDLWRGPALVGIDSRAVRRGAAVLDEQRAVAIEDWVDLELKAGRDPDLIAELSGLVETFPLRERLRAQLMLALCRAGRQADALAEYGRARAVLDAELGIEPGAELRDVQRRILVGDDPVRREPTDGVVRPPVRCLPRSVGDFTGRRDTVARLLAEIRQAGADAPVVQLIDGMAGSGKTTLALHVAGLVSPEYPDAQLYLDLHGHSRRHPVEPAAALVTLLRQLGVGAERIPTDPDARTALWRSELATRRVLLLLDNASSTAQVTPLLPAGPGSLVLITSRRRLTGLDGVRPESLQVLTEAEAVDLLTRIAGPRVAAEPGASVQVVRRCGRLPLAIRLAGGRLAHRPRWRVADLLHRLQEAVLPGLVADDRTVAGAFALSYEQLDEPARRLFRFAGLHPGGRFDALAVAALADLPQDAARDLLDDLVDAHLVEEPEPGHYRLHDLMREYAATLAAADPTTDTDAAIDRLLDFLTHAFLAANPEDQRALAVQSLGLGSAYRPDLVAAVPDPVAYLERERTQLSALVEAGVATGHRRHAWSLPRSVWRHLWTRGYIDDIAQLQRRALEIARAERNETAAAMSANYLASAHVRYSKYEEACELLKEAVASYRRIRDVESEAMALTNLSTVFLDMGLLTESADVAGTVLRMPYRTQFGIKLTSFALALARLGRYPEALHLLRVRLQMAVERREMIGLGISLMHIAELRVNMSPAAVPTAWRLLHAALRVNRGEGYRRGEAEVLNGMGVLHRMQHHHPQAVEAHRQALDLAVRCNERRYEAVFLNDLAITVRQSGDRAEAERQHRRALRLAGSIHHPFEQGRAHAGLAECLAAAEPTEARRHAGQALLIFRSMGVPERFEVERRLAGLATADQSSRNAIF